MGKRLRKFVKRGGLARELRGEGKRSYLSVLIKKFNIKENEMQCGIMSHSEKLNYDTLSHLGGVFEILMLTINDLKNRKVGI